MLTSRDVREFVAAATPGARRLAPAVRFSVIMPSFNQAPFIERSLNSVINQEYEGVELIVMDGGSQDGTCKLLERYSGHIAHWRSERDEGQSDALNKGFRAATGEIFGWLNSDDLYLPGALHHVAQIFATRPDVAVVYGDWLMIDEHDRILERCPALPPSRTRLVTEGFFCNAQAMFWRQSLHERLGELDVRLHYTMDFDLFLRMISVAGPQAFFRTPRPLGCFRVYAGQKTGSATDKGANEHRRVIERAGLTWKYAPYGRALRLAYRITRAAEYIGRQGPRYLLLKLTGRPAA
ncbi:MAG TPA: glycosyltransferase family 2 protein [Steroidobacteraceae bacterium]|nr:glycosyltransferase family 2 protein [Steroidobacteraceae bacterium]